jgi:membrane protein YdbS with pleckstrin-like domain
MARPDPLARRPRHGVLGRYLLDGELILTAVHQHWAKIAEPVASVFAGLILVLALDSALPATGSPLATLLWWAWFALVVRALWKIVEWRHDWFVATDKRLVLTYGLFTQRVAMMPLAKVTDMTYNRTPLGRMLGYGTFVMESAGQDQALHRVEWVPEPDHTYRAICAEIFGVEDEERAQDQPGLTRSMDGPPGPDTTDYSTAIPIRPTNRQPDDDAPDIHEADTGPIRY